MPRFCRRLAFCVLLAGVALAGPLAAEPAKKLLYIGIDGCRPDALRAAMTPHLDRLIARGVLAEKAQTGRVTVSGPGWTSALTGVWADKHGVFDNSFRGSNIPRYPHFFKRIKRARPEFKTASIVHWAPINFNILSGADIARIHSKDDEVAAAAETVLGTPAIDAVFVHFDDVDHAGHTFGFSPSEPRYLAAIEGVDGYIGRLLAAIAARPTVGEEDWLVLLTTDHGGSGTGHGEDIPEHRTIFVIASGASVEQVPLPEARIVDVPVTALAHLGIVVNPQWGLDGRPIGLKPAPGP